MPTLGYWKIRGLAQPIRLLLRYCGEDFEDKMYEQGDAPDFSREEWMKVKETLGLDFPNLPYYIDGKIKITQSNAILRYIARKHDMQGKTEEERVNVDIMLENAMDFRNAVMQLVYNPDYKERVAKYQNGAGDGKPSQMENFLKGFEKWMEGKQFFAGDKPTVADFPMYELLDQHRMMMPGCLKPYKNLTAFLDRFEALEPIKKYMTSDKFVKLPVNNKWSQFK